MPLPSRAARASLPKPEPDPDRRPAPVTVLREVRESWPPSPVPANSRRLTHEESIEAQRLIDAEGWDPKAAGDYLRSLRDSTAAEVEGDVG